MKKIFKRNFNRKEHNSSIFENVFILGGTSEIAKEICLSLAKSGTKRIHLVSRDSIKNKSFIDKLNNLFDLKVSSEEIDLLTYSQEKKPDVGFFDLYIIATGYLGNINFANNDHMEALKIAKINYYSLIPWINAILTKERINKPGSIWIISSVAGDRGRPSNYHYGAAKAALSIFCEGLYHRCYKKPFKVRIIKAGFVYTSMTIGKAPKFLCATTEYVAKTLIKNPFKEGVEYLPWWWAIVMKVVDLLPRSFITKL